MLISIPASLIKMHSKDASYSIHYKVTISEPISFILTYDLDGSLTYTATWSDGAVHQERWVIIYMNGIEIQKDQYIGNYTGGSLTNKTNVAHLITTYALFQAKLVQETESTDLITWSNIEIGYNLSFVMLSVLISILTISGAIAIILISYLYYRKTQKEIAEIKMFKED